MIEGFKKNKRIATLLTIIIAAIMLASLMGCTGTKYGSPANTSTVSNDPTEDTASPAVPEKLSEATKPPATAKPSDKVQNDSSSKSSASAEKYYGQWSVAKMLAYGAAGTYSKEDAEKLVGKNLSFSADEASVFTDQPSDTATVIKKPGYKIDTISGNDFLTNFRMSFDKLGIGADSVSELVISGSDASVYILLIKDSNTMILVAGGTYFELARVK